MGQNSSIEWTHHTFNPWIGCAKVGPGGGCKNCYAETLMDKRRGRVQWGPHGTRSRTSPATWKQPLQWNERRWNCPECGHWSKEGGECLRTVITETRHRDHDGPYVRGHSRPCPGVREFIERPRVFCASLADVFEDRDDLKEWRDDLFKLIDATPNLDWLLLTKRPERIPEVWPRGIYRPFGFVPCQNDRGYRPNVWMGTSVEDQECADLRIPQLLKAADLARFAFLSVEPLLGPVDLDPMWVTCKRCNGTMSIPVEGGGDPCPECLKPFQGVRPAINWVIVGGESGPGARPMHPEWARSIVKQCAEAQVPVLFKQWGEWAPCGKVHSRQDFYGGRCVEGATGGVTSVLGMVERGRMVEMSPGVVLEKVGKKKAGRVLDGVTHNAFPQ